LHLPLLRDRSDKADLVRTLLHEENAGQESIRDRRRRLPQAAGLFLARQYPSAAQCAADASALCRRRDHPPVDLPQGNSHTTPARAPSRRPSAAANVESAGGEPSVRRVARRRVRGLIEELERSTGISAAPRRALGISRNTLYRKIHKHNIVLEQ